jgi:hypothetical protein
MLREFLNINCSHPDGSLATWKEDCILAGAAIKYVAPLLTTSTSLLGLWLPQGGAVFEGRKVRHILQTFSCTDAGSISTM